MVKFIRIEEKELSDQVDKVVKELGKKLQQPIHLIEIYLNNHSLSQESKEYFKKSFDKNNIKNEVYEIWVKSDSFHYLDRNKTNFTKKDYTGTVVLMEDRMFKGFYFIPIECMLKEMKPKKDFYSLYLFDW